MNKLAYALAALTIISPLTEVNGEEPPFATIQEQGECTEQVRERTAAIGAMDWPQLDRIARRFIQSCTGVYTRQEIANAYGDVASANNAMGRFKEALVQANAGIATHYLETSNHLEKVTALFALLQISEAKESFRVADNIIQLAIERNSAELQKARNDSERNLFQANKVLYESQLRAIDRYRPQLGKK
jgi:hypothetical protein